jgi:hypothetical protein
MRPGSGCSRVITGWCDSASACVLRHLPSLTPPSNASNATPTVAMNTAARKRGDMDKLEVESGKCKVSDKCADALRNLLSSKYLLCTLYLSEASLPRVLAASREQPRSTSAVLVRAPSSHAWVHRLKCHQQRAVSSRISGLHRQDGEMRSFLVDSRCWLNGEQRERAGLG